MNLSRPNTHRRAAWIIGLILATASVSGYFMGLRQTGSQLNRAQMMSLAVSDPERHEAAPASVTTAKRYKEQNRRSDGPNAGWSNHLTALSRPAVNRDLLTNVSDEERAAALIDRAARRAYDGAPPVIPHPIAQDSAASCLACHGEGMIVKGRIASRMSHELHSNCTQCHVPSSGIRLPTLETALLEPIAENAFVGLNPPGKGNRAWPEAPPTIPHSTHMRNDCLSCHGPQGRPGLRTPHPERQSCLQCHAPEADRNQHLLMPLIAPQPRPQPGNSIAQE